MQKKLLIIAGLVVIALGALVLIRVPEAEPITLEHTGNFGEITGNMIVGQTFIASQDNLSSISVMMATYSGRDNTHPVLFELKESPTSANVLRKAEANPKNFGDNRFHEFSFEPVSGSAGKTFFFTLASPDSIQGNAVAVDTNNTDPYPLGAGYLVRDTGNAPSASLIERSGKQDIDLVFHPSYHVPLGVYSIRTAKQAIVTFITTWNDARHLYVLWAGAFIPIAAYALFGLFLFRTKKNIGPRYILSGLFLAAFIMRMMYAKSLPFTVDEGNYLYDAWALLQGTFAGGDGYVKAPLFILWTALMEILFGNAALAGRIGSALAGAGMVFPIFVLVQTIWNTRAGYLCAALWAASGAAVVANVYVHTQSVAMFFGVSGIAALAYALKDKKEHTRWLIMAGVIIGLSVASRKSMLAMGLAVVLLLVALSSTWKRRVRNTALVGAGFLAVLAVFFTFAYSVYGTEGVIEAIGINSATDGVSTVEESQIEQVRAYSLRGMTPFFRESLPLILLSLLGVGFSLKKKIFWILPLAVFWWAWDFFSEYEGSAFMAYGIWMLWPLFGGILLLSSLLGNGKKTAKEERGRTLAQGLLGPIWVGSFMFFYINWIKFHANYIAEFIPPLVIMGGVGVDYFIRHAQDIASIWRKRIILALFIGTALWAGTVSNFITYLFEHTGQFSQRAAKEAALWAEENIPKDKEIFTGAALIPYLSGHRVSLDIAHPRWYAYEFTRTNPKRLETFLPSTEAMLNAYRNADWFLLESQTGFSFLMEYSEIEKGLATDWERVHGVENGSNTLTFYKRIR